MIPLDVSLIRRGDPPPLAQIPVEKLDVQMGNRPIAVHVLEGGMQSGAPSVVIALTREDGTVVVFETSARLFCAAAATARAFCEQIGFTDLAQL